MRDGRGEKREAGAGAFSSFIAREHNGLGPCQWHNHDPFSSPPPRASPPFPHSSEGIPKKMVADPREALGVTLARREVRVLAARPE